MTTSTDITNRALAEIGSRSQIANMTDGSTEARYANLLYTDLRDFMLRQADYDFAMTGTAAGASIGAPFGWQFAYTYPNSALRIRSLVPLVYNRFDPVPVEFTVAQFTVGTRVILTQAAIQEIFYTFGATEDTWDTMFTEAFVRMLASALAFALQNRIEASKEKLSEALTFAGIANLRDG